MNKIEAYKCEFCGEIIGESEDDYKEHLYYCRDNPDTQSCETCAHLENSKISDNGSDKVPYICQITGIRIHENLRKFCSKWKVK